MSDYLGWYIANGFPPLPKAARVEIRGRAYCDGWPRDGEGIAYYNYKIVRGAFGGRMKVTRLQVLLARRQMSRALIQELTDVGYRNVELMASEQCACGTADAGQSICWQCGVKT